MEATLRFMAVIAYKQVNKDLIIVCGPILYDDPLTCFLLTLLLRHDTKFRLSI